MTQPSDLVTIPVNRTSGLSPERVRAFLTGLCRVVLGGIFVYAALAKIGNYQGFTVAINNYQILSALLTPVVARVLPWMELVIGGLLVLGFFVRPASVAAAILLTCFTGALILALTRGSGISCGCFSCSPAPISCWTIVRDITLILMAVFVYGSEKKTSFRSRN
jgi:putative oxidoreductase